MWEDPIVEETRASRQELVDEFGDIHALFQYLREREQREPERIVSLSPNSPESVVKHVASR